ncbi:MULTISPECIES: RDD family protein [Pseudomonas]|uniref:RDD family protein n=1 Tax=Pseudomonas soli TaxID=1306993 RepID=A0AAJ5MH95_9PSED|nr:MULTISPECIES: RDD family protein [Pseudomonas]AIN58672.1 membrane protein [Pseudomonas soli]MDX2310549.1 RDD family protein [Pseudomonas sp. On1]PYC44467.1 RDD family protein [Pseudomonas soli]UXZ43640.1 RDD family protein [Pseudomonas soli]
MSTTETPATYQKPSNLAGLGRRWGGQMIDVLVTYAIFFVTFSVVEFLQLSEQISVWISFGVPLAYYLFSDALPNGQSVGKKLLGICVVDERSYLNCNIAQSFVRNITTPLNILDWIFIFFGSRKRLGDMLAHTIVIKA